MQGDDGFVTSRNKLANYLNNLRLLSIVVNLSLLSLYNWMNHLNVIIFPLKRRSFGGDFEIISKNIFENYTLRGYNAASKCR
jgi:hypothetical protein